MFSITALWADKTLSREAVRSPGVLVCGVRCEGQVPAMPSLFPQPHWLLFFHSQALFLPPSTSFCFSHWFTLLLCNLTFLLSPIAGFGRAALCWRRNSSHGFSLVLTLSVLCIYFESGGHKISLCYLSRIREPGLQAGSHSCAGL